MSSRVNLLLLQRRGSMKLNWFAEREREKEVLKVNDSNRMKIVMCVHVLVKCISEISIHIPICVELYRGMHCITIQWCLKIWQSKIVTWFSTNNNDMRSTQNNFFFLFLSCSRLLIFTHTISFDSSHLFASTFSSESFPRKGGGGVVIW